MSAKPEHLLVDGYNLIKSSHFFHRPEQSLEQARLGLQRALDAHSRRTQSKITLYYDGDGADDLARQSRYGDIQIIFSRSPETADDLIMSATQDKHGAKWLRVISSDREIRRCAERHKIRSTRSEDFLDELDAALSARPQQPLNTAPSAEHSTPDELDEWERLFAAKPVSTTKPPPAHIDDGSETHPNLDKRAVDEWERLFEQDKRDDQGQ